MPPNSFFLITPHLIPLKQTHAKKRRLRQAGGAIAERDGRQTKAGLNTPTTPTAAARGIQTPKYAAKGVAQRVSYTPEELHNTRGSGIDNQRSFKEENNGVG
ncbi:hypothetical protein PIB30_003895 [Stylosanthes scabra]|uniref:Uncharacterized protein n=1 Tax=Stylosanthes scabra TaxID=79078 RepID=A0ABU6U558_9FABA|nr:hypothetical protein [Stylosanthes scabra]